MDDCELMEVLNLFKKIHQEIVRDSKEISLACLRDKYSHLKKKKIDSMAKVLIEKFTIKEAFDYLDNGFVEETIDLEERTRVYSLCIKKINGIYKHAQALKTGICNIRIMSSSREIIDGTETISICITKNTLESNEQWLVRLCADMKTTYGSCEDKIILISSRTNNLDVTHCESLADAMKLLKRENKFKVVILCSNKVRINDTLELVEDFRMLIPGLARNVRIYHDEAHNRKDGVPAFRALIENILVQPNVLSYSPITASNEPINDEVNPMWNRVNLESFAINYTDIDATISTDPSYSSCANATRIIIDELSERIDYEVTEVDAEMFRKVHEKELLRKEKSLRKKPIEELSAELFSYGEESENRDEIIQKLIGYDVEERRKLEFCRFMVLDKELEAMNNGCNVLRLNNLLQFNYFIPDEFNIHIISTPRRKIITHYLAVESQKMPYIPITLAIYGDEGEKYHLFYDGREEEVSEIMGRGEFNTKLGRLILHLQSQHVNTRRPFIIMGNYITTGESLTFVNSTYGTVRGNIKLISTNPEDDYQEACRNNYMITKFLESDPNWTMPEKFLVGPRQFIENALMYEKKNDERIRDFCQEEATVELGTRNGCVGFEQGRVSVPIKITFGDLTHDTVVKLFDIAKKERRTAEEKEEFMRLLKECKDDEEADCTFIDKTGKFDFEFKLNRFRTYRKTESNPADWRFKSYKEKHDSRLPYMNERNKIALNECEILTCVDMYIHKAPGGELIHKNPKSVWWLSYRFQ